MAVPCKRRPLTARQKRRGAARGSRWVAWSCRPGGRTSGRQGPGGPSRGGERARQRGGTRQASPFRSAWLGRCLLIWVGFPAANIPCRENGRPCCRHASVGARTVHRTMLSGSAASTVTTLERSAPRPPSRSIPSRIRPQPLRNEGRGIEPSVQFRSLFCRCQVTSNPSATEKLVLYRESTLLVCSSSDNPPAAFGREQ